VITGGTRGIGAATAVELGRQGYTVVVTGRSQEAADAAAARLRGAGIDAGGVVLEVTSADSVARAVRQLEADHGRVDVLVNNAGILPEATEAGPETVAKTFATNTIGPFLVTDAMLPLLRRSESGRVVNVSSRMGSLAEQADPASAYYSMVLPAYQASKAALNSYTISLAKSLADTAIVVTSVCPGFVQTDLTPTSRDLAPLTPEQAARPVVAAATAPAGSPSGTFVDVDGEIRW
jgi:NAD(P)-dependent dehydrogenase (short-subunit alcohol dehydrogenase family)